MEQKSEGTGNILIYQSENGLTRIVHYNTSTRVREFIKYGSISVHLRKQIKILAAQNSVTKTGFCASLVLLLCWYLGTLNR